MPGRSKRPVRGDLLLPSKVLSKNLRAVRSLRDLSQQQLADRMTSLGHDWSRATVSEVERHHRSVDYDELIGLALALETTIAELGDPYGPGSGGGQIDLGVPQKQSAAVMHLWLRDRVAPTYQEGNPLAPRVRFRPFTAEMPSLVRGALRAIEEGETPWEPGQLEHVGHDEKGRPLYRRVLPGEGDANADDLQEPQGGAGR